MRTKKMEYSFFYLSLSILKYFPLVFSIYEIIQSARYPKITICYTLKCNTDIEKTAANKHSGSFLRNIQNMWKVKLTGYISYQMYITWSCVTFYHLLNRFPQANDSLISTFWRWFNIEVYTRSTWLHFKLSLS